MRWECAGDKLEAVSPQKEVKTFRGGVLWIDQGIGIK